MLKIIIIIFKILLLIFIYFIIIIILYYYFNFKDGLAKTLSLFCYRFMFNYLEMSLCWAYYANPCLGGGLQHDKVEGYALYNFFPVFRSAI
jgi:hypothetical protein